MISLNKQTRTIYLLIILFLTLMVGYFYNLLISSKAKGSVKVTASSLKTETIINNLEKKYQSRKVPPSISRTHCPPAIKIEITKLYGSGWISLEGLTTPGVSVIINGEIKLKADSKGVFKTDYERSWHRNLIIEAFDSQGNSGRLVCKSCQ